MATRLPSTIDVTAKDDAGRWNSAARSVVKAVLSCPFSVTLFNRMPKRVPVILKDKVSTRMTPASVVVGALVVVELTATEDSVGDWVVEVVLLLLKPVDVKLGGTRVEVIEVTWVVDDDNDVVVAEGIGVEDDDPVTVVLVVVVEARVVAVVSCVVDAGVTAGVVEVVVTLIGVVEVTVVGVKVVVGAAVEVDIPVDVVGGADVTVDVADVDDTVGVMVVVETAAVDVDVVVDVPVDVDAIVLCVDVVVGAVVDDIVELIVVIVVVA